MSYPGTGLNIMDRITGLIDYGSGRRPFREEANTFENCHLERIMDRSLRRTGKRVKGDVAN
jgi:hypothetical protein